jgi:hypothetical protein
MVLPLTMTSHSARPAGYQLASRVLVAKKNFVSAIFTNAMNVKAHFAATVSTSTPLTAIGVIPPQQTRWLILLSGNCRAANSRTT